MKKDLVKIFEQFAKNAWKLAAHGSSQVNKSHHNTMASKAPKTRHYGSSDSLNFRVAAAVCQKNEGFGYLAQANKDLTLSPGSHTLSYAEKLDKSRTQARDRQGTQKVKRHRLELKEKSSKSTSVNELQEGKLHYPVSASSALVN